MVLTGVKGTMGGTLSLEGRDGGQNREQAATLPTEIVHIGHFIPIDIGSGSGIHSTT